MEIWPSFSASGSTIPNAATIGCIGQIKIYVHNPPYSSVVYILLNYMSSRIYFCVVMSVTIFVIYVVNICFICGFLLRLNGVRHYFHIRKSSCRWTVIRQMPLVGQDCLHFWNTWFHPNFRHVVHTAESFLFGVMYWGSLFVLSFFCWPL